MKEINEMTRQEVLDEIIQAQLELDSYNNRMFDLEQALIHNFPHMIGGDT
jgi:hypothetical protein